MRKISIKTVDGGRFDYEDKQGLIPDVRALLNSWPYGAFYGFPTSDGVKYFNKDNIVSITEKEIDDA